MKNISRSEAKAQGLKRYFTGTPCKHGHVSERITSNGDCLGCSKMRRDSEEGKRKASEYRKDMYKTEKYRKYKRDYCRDRRANNEEVRERERLARDTDEHRAKNREYMREYRKREVAKKHKESKNASRRTDEFRASERERMKNCKKSRATRFCRDSLRRVLLSTGEEKNKRTKDMLGYSSSELIERIESTLKDGMSWDNYGEWHIDHIKPVAQFIKEGETDPSVINRLENLQALWKNENLSKGRKF